MFEKRKTLPQNLKEIFPFSSHYLTLPDGEWVHYIDEGTGPLLVLVHGNPTWSFMYRQLIAYFRKTHRVIAFDHVGMGLSSRPLKYSYTLRQHSRNLKTLLAFIGVGREIKSFNMLVHDWGGPIGLSAAMDLSPAYDLSLVDQLFITNTAGFRSQNIPARINILRGKIGGFFITKFNIFAKFALFMAPAQSLHSKVKEGYLFPYQTPRDRLGILNFVKDIPLTPDDESYSALKRIEEKLKTIKKTPTIIWGMKDFCFNINFLNTWKKIYPDALVIELKGASHYLFEDAPKEIIEKMETVMNSAHDLESPENTEEDATSDIQYQ